MQTAYRNLQEFIRVLDDAGELLRITAPVSRVLEITRITDIMSKSPGGGKALLFEHVQDSEFPVLTNAFGSERRICMALGVPDLEVLSERLRRLLQVEPPKSAREAFRMIPVALDLLRFLPRKVRNAPCQEVVQTGEAVNLTRLPVLKCWPQDGGPFVTLPVVITRSLRTGKRNAGMYRLQVYDRNTTGMHWHIHKDGSHYYQEYREARRRMPVAVAIGTDPAVTYAATAPLPRGMDEVMLAGFIRRKPVPLVRCLTVDLEVPAEAEFVLEGYVEPDELRVEGPFGDHTGYYSLVGDYPVFHVTAVTHRRHPVYPATVVGIPPMEDCYLARATERLFLPLMNAVMPEVRDFWMPWEGVFHNAAVIAIHKEYAGHARRVMSAVWGQGQMSFCKIAVIVDSSMDLKRPRQVFETILNRLDLENDLFITEGVLDVLDHSSPQPLFGGKLGIDATRRFPDEKPRTEPPATTLPHRQELDRTALEACAPVVGCHVPIPNVKNPLVLLNIRKDGVTPGRETARRILAQAGFSAFSIIVLYDEHIDLTDSSLVLWKAFNNVDPKRDIVQEAGRIVVDATRKGMEDGHNRPWPDDIIMDPQVVKAVRGRAEELGIDRFF